MNVWQRSTVDQHGDVLPLAEVAVRDQVTSVLVQLYSDYEATTPIGNPTAADAEGFVRFYVATGLYQITATLGGDTRVWENEQLGVTGETLEISRTVAEIAAGIVPVSLAFRGRYIDPGRYGAVGNYDADDTDALQEAIDVARYKGHGIVDVQCAGYRITSPLIVQGPVRIIGENCINTVIYADGFSTGQNVIEVDGTLNLPSNLEFGEISGLTLMSSDDVPDLLMLNRVASFTVRDMILRNCRHGIICTGDRTYSNLFENVKNGGGMTGSNVRFIACAGGQHTFLHCSFGGSEALVIGSSGIYGGLDFYGCNFESCSSQVAAITGNVDGLGFSKCRFEANAAGFDIRPGSGEEIFGLEFNNCQFDTVSEAYAISIGGDAGTVRGFSIKACVAEDYSSYFVRFNGDGHSGEVSFNKMKNTPAVVNGVPSGVLVINNEDGSGNPLGAQWNPPLSTPTYTAGAHGTLRDFTGTTTADHALQLLETLVEDLQAAGVLKA